MKVAPGFKAHSGWAALVVIGGSKSEFVVTYRRRISLVEEDSFAARQPYHAAEKLKPGEAETLVKNYVDATRRAAIREIKAIAKRCVYDEHEIVACSVLVPEPMPAWSNAEIVAVHIRMHKAEGVLFPDALCRAVEACKLHLVAVREKQLAEQVEKTFGVTFDRAMASVTALGKTVGPPWGKDQKTATLGAMIALR